jgi:hypothetical protein
MPGIDEMETDARALEFPREQRARKPLPEDEDVGAHGYGGQLRAES